MRKILQISSCLSGSTGRIAQQIGNKAIEDGWESWIAYSGREPRIPSKSSVIPIGSKFVSQVHAIITRLFDLHGYGSYFSTRRLVKQIDTLRPDIIHLHNIHGYYINFRVLFKYLKESRIPVVWTLHDCWPFTGHCVHYTDVNCYKWRDGTCSKCPKQRSYPSSIFFDRSKYNFKSKKSSFSSLKYMTIVPVSYWLGRVAAESFLGIYRIQVIQNGIDINAFYPRKGCEKVLRKKYSWGNRFVILGVAKGWSEDVGLSTFYKLRESLNNEYAIVMVGLTKKQIAELPSGITGITHTEHDELAEIYTASDVLFNGSYQETFGLVTAEAMACGTPAIVYNSTACPEIVDNDRGRIVPVGDFDKLLKAVCSLKELSEEDKERMSATCVEFVRTNLDKNKKYQEYINLYNSLLENE